VHKFDRMYYTINSKRRSVENMKITVLASGSKGNCTYYETATAKVMIDCGISYRQVRQRLAINDIELTDLDALFITHEHADHVSGVSSLLAKQNADIYMSAKAYGKMHANAKSGIDVENLNFIDEVIMINNLKVTAIKTSHDSAEALGFILEEDGIKVVHITDTGYLPRSLFEQLEDADFYLMESNYEPELLLESTRPFYLKQRILGNQGHLSNLQAALILKELITERTKGVIYLHLSGECNSAFEAKLKHKEIIPNYDDYEMIYSFQHKPTKLIELIPVIKEVEIEVEVEVEMEVEVENEEDETY